jgi:alpha-galactosidase
MSLHNDLALTPPMGWNSWDCYGTSVREDEVKANARFMAERLAKFGWEYVVVDIQWYEPEAKAGGYRPNAFLIMDEYSRLIPAPNRFPSSAGGQGFKPLADFIHNLGLKFGIHIMRGIPRQAVRGNSPILGTPYRAADIANQDSTCPWNDDMFGLDMVRPGAQAYYDSLISLYASWGVDYIKTDDINWPYRPAEISAIAKAIKKSGRPILLSLSPGNRSAGPDQLTHLQNHCELSRISDDFWDRWEDLKEQFELCRRWSPYRAPGYWPDADMLPLGRISIRGERGPDRQSLLTKEEQLTLMTLWSIFRSPLMMGGDLPSLDEFTLGLLTNEEVLKVNQASSGNRELFHQGEKVAWVADAPEGGKYLALFNLGDTDAVSIEVNLSELQGPGSKWQVRDLWQKQNAGLFENSFSSLIPPHGSRLVSLYPAS